MGRWGSLSSGGAKRRPGGRDDEACRVAKAQTRRCPTCGSFSLRHFRHDGQITFGKTEALCRFVKSLLKKDFCCPRPQITSRQYLSCPDERGVSRTYRTRGRTRWTWAASLTIEAACGRQSRGGLTPRRWCLACGTQFPKVMVANKPGTPGRPRRSC